MTGRRPAAKPQRRTGRRRGAAGRPDGQRRRVALRRRCSTAGTAGTPTGTAGTTARSSTGSTTGQVSPRLLADGLLRRTPASPGSQQGNPRGGAEDGAQSRQIVDSVDHKPRRRFRRTQPRSPRCGLDRRSAGLYRLGGAGIPCRWDEQGDLLVLGRMRPRRGSSARSRSPDESSTPASRREDDGGGLAARRCSPTCSSRPTG